MGIRFFCPNGHKLNVKSHLAGKVGYCPHCDVRLEIPVQSTRMSSKLGGGPITDEPHATTQTKVPVVSENYVFDDADIVNILEEPHELLADIVLPVPRTQKGGSKKVSTSLPPCLAEEGIEWFVQIPGGGQYGPKSGETLFSWICEKRISGDMLLWHEGWKDWQEARKVIPANLFPKISAK